MGLLTNVGKNSEETRRALNRMFSESYNNLCSLENAEVNPHSYYSFNVGPKQARIYRPSANRNGKTVKLPVPLSRKYLKFALPLNIFCEKDKQDKRNKVATKPVLSVAERSSLNRTSLEVFADNFKVPDTECFITVMDGSTDVYVPAKYFEENGSMLDIIVRRYNKNEIYVNCTITGVSSLPDVISLCGCSTLSQGPVRMISSCGAENMTIGPDDFRIYKNGLLLQPDQYKLTPIIDYTIISLTLTTELIKSDTIEICVEPDTTYHVDKISITSPIVTFPEDVLPFLLPISPGICDIYIEGKRAFAKDIQVLSPRVFKLKESVYLENARLSVFMNYTGKLIPDNFDFKEDTSRYLHCITEQEKMDIFLNNKYPDTGLEWVTKAVFPGEKIIDETKFNSKESYEKYLDDSIKAYLDENAHNIIPLMSQFSLRTDETRVCDQKYIKDHTRTSTAEELGKISYGDSTFVTFDGQTFLEEMVLFTTPKKHDTAEEILFEINDVKVKRSLAKVINSGNMFYIYVPKSLFPKQGSFKVDIKHAPVYNKDKKCYSIHVNNHFLATGSAAIDEDAFGNVQNLSDIYVYKKTKDGYSLVKENETVYTLKFCTPESGKPYILFTLMFPSEGDDYLLVNTSFFDYRLLTVGPNDIDWITMDDELSRPSCSRYGLLVYVNGKLQAENNDYFLTSQLTHTSLHSGRIVFRNRPSVNDTVELYFVEEPKVRFSKCKVLNLPYDVVYIKNLEAGFSKEYMDLYINNVKIPEDRIVEIALNLVLIKDMPIHRPYATAFVKSRLSRPVTNIYDYIQYYQTHQSDFKLYIDRLIHDNNLDTVLKIVEAFVTDETKHDIADNKVVDDDISPIIDTIAKHLRDGLISRRIDANRTLEFLKLIEYIQLMSDEDWDLPTLDLNANSHNISINLDINPLTHMKSVEEITKLVSKAMFEGKLPGLDNKHWDANKEFSEKVSWVGTVLDKDSSGEEYYQEKYPISKQIYWEEYKLADPSLVAPNIFNIDANVNIENEDDYTEEEVTISVPVRKLKKRPKNYDKDGKPVLSPNNTLEFIYTYDMKPFSVYEVKKVVVNYVEQTLNGQFIYSSSLQELQFLRAIDSRDKIEIKFTRKVYTK